MLFINDKKELIHQIVKCKFELKSVYKALNDCQSQLMKLVEEIRVFERQYEQEWGETFILTKSSVIPKCYGSVFKVKAKEMSLRYQLSNLEQEMFELIGQADDYLTLNEKVQLLGGGMKRAYKAMNRCYQLGIDDVIMMDLVMFRTEFIKETARTKISLLHHPWEIPIFTACLAVISKPSAVI